MRDTEDNILTARHNRVPNLGRWNRRGRGRFNRCTKCPQLSVRLFIYQTIFKSHTKSPKNVVLTPPILLYSLSPGVTVTVTITAPTSALPAQSPVTAPKLSCPMNN